MDCSFKRVFKTCVLHNDSECFCCVKNEKKRKKHSSENIFVSKPGISALGHVNIKLLLLISLPLAVVLVILLSRVVEM